MIVQILRFFKSKKQDNTCSDFGNNDILVRMDKRIGCGEGKLNAG